MSSSLAPSVGPEREVGTAIPRVDAGELVANLPSTEVPQISPRNHEADQAAAVVAARATIADSAPEPAPSAAHESAWLQQQQAEHETWLRQQQDAHTTWSEEQRSSAAEWASQPSLNLKETVQAATAGDKQAVRALAGYCRQADAAELIQPEFEPLWQTDTFRYAVYSKIADMRIQSMRDKVKFDDHQIKLVDRAFSHFGFNQDEWPSLTKAWLSYRLEKHNPHTYVLAEEIDEKKVKSLKKQIYQNLDAMEHIERAQPGAVKALHGQDGIRNFERYHEGELLRQAQDPSRVTDIVTMGAAADWLGSASRGGTHNLIRRFTRWNSTSIRHLEASTPSEFHDRLSNTVAQTGRPIKKLIIRMHSDAEKGDLGDEPLTLDDIYGLNGRPPVIDEGILAPGAEIVFYGCKAGAKNGLAQALADVTGARVMASPENVSGVVRKRLKGVTFTSGGSPVETVSYGPSRLVAATKRVLGRLTRRQSGEQ